MSTHTPESITDGTLQKWACTLCASRKVKCNRISPCNGCVKAGVECVFKAPPPPKRRKRKADGEPVEDTQSQFQEPEPLNSHTSSQTDQLLPDSNLEIRAGNNAQPLTLEGAAMMLVKPGESRYLENNLWMALGDEIRNRDDLLDRPRYEPVVSKPKIDSGAMIFGSGSASPQSFESLLDYSEHTEALWQAFVENVEPLHKAIHLPTLEVLVQKRWAERSPIAPEIEALLLSVFSAGAMSLCTPNDSEVAGISAKALKTQYLEACQKALIQAEFLKSSSLMVVQAFLLYLISSFGDHDPNSFYSLSGILARNAQRLGLHRDGTLLNLTPFETEIRRRIWWNIIFVDVRAAEISGAGTASVAAHSTDTKRPSNINDSDFDPQMKSPPEERQGATDATFLLLRCTVGEFLKNSAMGVFKYGGSWQKLATSSISAEEKYKEIDQLEEDLEARFLRYTDPLIPLQTLTSIVARAIICKMKIIAHRRQRHNNRDQELSQEDKDSLFSNCLKMVEYNNLGSSSPTLRRFIWHAQINFQWHAIIYLLKDLQQRTSGTQVEKAWKELDCIFDCHPEIIANRRSTLHRAVVILCRNAWKAREGFLEQHNQSHKPKPRLVQKILPLSKEELDFPTPAYSTVSYETPAWIANAQPIVDRRETLNEPQYNFEDFSVPLGEKSDVFDINSLDWTEWDALFKDYQM